MFRDDRSSFELSFGMSLPAVVQRPSTQERLKQLVAATPALITEVSLDGVLQRAVQISAEVIGAHYAAIGVVASDGRTLEHFTTYGVDAEWRLRSARRRVVHGILGIMIREASRSGLPDLTKHPDYRGIPPHHPPMRSFLGVPIFGNGGVLGNLYVAEKIGGETFTAGGRRHRDSAGGQDGRRNRECAPSRGECSASRGSAAAPTDP